MVWLGSWTLSIQIICLFFFLRGGLGMNVQQRSVCLFLCICRIWLLDKDTGSTADNSSVPLSRSVSSVSLTKRQGSQWIIPLSLCQGISDCPTSSPWQRDKDLNGLFLCRFVKVFLTAPPLTDGQQFNRLCRTGKLLFLWQMSLYFIAWVALS